jgi:hypothetical protein
MCSITEKILENSLEVFGMQKYGKHSGTWAVSQSKLFNADLELLVDFQNLKTASHFNSVTILSLSTGYET